MFSKKDYFLLKTIIGVIIIILVIISNKNYIVYISVMVSEVKKNNEEFKKKINKITNIILHFLSKSNACNKSKKTKTERNTSVLSEFLDTEIQSMVSPRLKYLR